MKLTMIRHGMTAGNEQRRYTGRRTDELLSAAGRREIEEAAQAGRYPALADGDILVAGPMERTIQTAELIYPGTDYVTVDAFREIDFGEFEGHTWYELSGDPRYQAWIDSGGLMPFPGGEDRARYVQNVIDAFDRLVEDTVPGKTAEEEHKSGAAEPVAQGSTAVPGPAGSPAQIVIVTHGGVIMAVLSSVAGGDYYDYMCPNGSGFTCEITRTQDGKLVADETVRLA